MQTSHKTFSLVIGCGIFLALGALTAAIGPVLPEFAANTGSTLAELGLVFTAIFLGALPAQLVSGPLGDRIGRQPVLVGSMLLLALGTWGMLSSHSLSLLLASTVVTGLGHGSADVSTTVLVAEVFSKKNVSALNTLNVFYGVGAVAGPAMAAAALGVWGTGLPALAAGAVILVVLAPFILLTRAGGKRVRTEQPLPDSASIGAYRSPLLWTLGSLILIYVGVENGVGGWTTTYIQRTTGLALEMGALVTSGFWLALTVGRLLTAVLATRLTSFAILYLSLGGALAGGVLLAISAGQAYVTIAATLALGLFFGSVYPTVMAITTQMFRSSPGKAASVVAGMGSLGGMLVPWAQGLILENAGPAASSAFVAAGAFAMLALYTGITRRGLVFAHAPTDGAASDFDPSDR